MGNFWKIVNDVIMESDVLIVVLDARMPHDTRNIEVEDKVGRQGKRLICVVNKMDLVDKDALLATHRIPKDWVLVSSKERKGGTVLLRRLLALGQKKEITVGVLGYPNVGKSSIINLLKGRSSARVSSIAGHTRSIQKVRIHKLIMLLDTPGVIPYKEKDTYKHTKMGASNPHRLRDVEGIVYELLLEEGKLLSAHYGVTYLDDPEAFLEEIARRKNILAKGGLPDTVRMARQILHDWQKGHIHLRQKQEISEKADRG